MKIKHFSHTDLDGVGSAVIIKALFPKKEDVIDVAYCDYDKINQKVRNFIESKHCRSYDYIFITDISVDEPTAALLQKIHENDEEPFVQLLESSLSIAVFSILKTVVTMNYIVHLLTGCLVT